MLFSTLPQTWLIHQAGDKAPFAVLNHCLLGLFPEGFFALNPQSVPNTMHLPTSLDADLPISVNNTTNHSASHDQNLSVSFCLPLPCPQLNPEQVPLIPPLLSVSHSSPLIQFQASITAHLPHDSSLLNDPCLWFTPLPAATRNFLNRSSDHDFILLFKILLLFPEN